MKSTTAVTIPGSCVQDPNRLVPVDVMREMEREGAIGALHDWFYSTTGLTCIVEVMKGLGKKIAESLKAEGVSGVHPDLHLRDEHALRCNARKGNREGRNTYRSLMRCHSGGRNGRLQQDPSRALSPVRRFAGSQE